MNKKLNKWVGVGDRVVATSGNEKGQTGKVLTRTEKRVVVEGLNIRKKHVKPQSRMQQRIVEMEGSMHATNVSICDEEGKPVKLKVKVEGDKRRLVYTKEGKEVVYRDVKKKKA